MANCYLPLARKALQDSWLGSFLLLGIYSDLTPGWYQTVGRSLMISQIIGIGTRLAETSYYVFRSRWKVGTVLNQGRVE